MYDLARILLPELILVAMACALFLVGMSSKASARRLAPVLALATLAGVFAMQAWVVMTTDTRSSAPDAWNTVRQTPFTDYVKLLTAGVGVLLVLLAWPTNPDATGSRSLHFGADAGEFFALMLLSLSGVMLVSVANDIVLLFLAIELASIPTYIMVSISRPIPAAQEAGVKYFFLGAMAAAVMLFGFSYLYGTTGLTKLDEIARAFRAASPDPDLGAAAVVGPAAPLTGWRTLAVLMLIAGFAFKIAAVPLHAYAGDVYQGAATPVTAFLAFVPKTSGMVAIIKLLATVGGTRVSIPPEIVRLLWVLAALSMTVGNVLGLMQVNVKRVLAYSSIAHSGYMLVGLTAWAASSSSGAVLKDVPTLQQHALQGVLFYLAAYGIMNAAAFGVLAMLPSRGATLTALRRRRRDHVDDVTPPATTAETYEDLAGQGRRHPLLGLAMAVSCFSLIGLPLTVGFFGKLYLIKPALDAKLIGLVVVTLVNAAISAAYYLQIVGTMFLRPDPATAEAVESDIEDAAAESTSPEPYSRRLFPIGAAVTLSALLTLLFGTVFPATGHLSQRVAEAAFESPQRVAPPPSPAQVSNAGDTPAQLTLRPQ